MLLWGEPFYFFFSPPFIHHQTVFIDSEHCLLLWVQNHKDTGLICLHLVNSGHYGWALGSLSNSKWKTLMPAVRTRPGVDRQWLDIASMWDHFTNRQLLVVPSGIVKASTLLRPGLDNTRLFMSFTAGAGTRCMSLLSSSPSPYGRLMPCPRHASKLIPFRGGFISLIVKHKKEEPPSGREKKPVWKELDLVFPSRVCLCLFNIGNVVKTLDRKHKRAPFRRVLWAELPLEQCL